MNIRIYKENWLFMAFSILVLCLAVGIGQDGDELSSWQEQLVAMLDFIANEAPHS